MGTHSILKIIANQQKYKIYYQYDGNNLFGIVVKDLLKLYEEYGSWRAVCDFVRYLPILDYSDEDKRDDNRTMGLKFILDIGGLPKFDFEDDGVEYTVIVDFDIKKIHCYSYVDRSFPLCYSSFKKLNITIANYDLSEKCDQWEELTRDYSKLVDMVSGNSIIEIIDEVNALVPIKKLINRVVYVDVHKPVKVYSKIPQGLNEHDKKKLKKCVIDQYR